MNASDLEQQSQQEAALSALTDDPAVHEFFAKHAAKHGQTLQPGEYGYELQRAEKARADGAGITEPLLDKPTQDNSIAPTDLHPSLRVPDTPFGYQIPVPATKPEHRQEVEQLGTWMRSAGLSAGEGNFIAKAAAAAAREPMSDAALAQATRALHSNLQRAWGNDYRGNLDGLKAQIDRLDQQHGGKVWQWLDANPEVMTSPTVVKSLAHHFLQKRR
jgi:hypothetical protein